MSKKIKFKKFNFPFNTVVSTKDNGPVYLNCNFAKSDSLKKIAKEFNFDINNLFLGEQIHGNNIKNINKLKGKFYKKNDGFISDKSGVILAIATADCLPIIMAAPVTNYFGIFHAGYRGILNGILEKALNEFISFGSDLSNLIVGIGPGIEAKCYDVKVDRINSFKEKYFKFNNYYFKKEDKYFLDLKKLSLNIIKSFGVKNKNIEVMNFCTRCNNDLFYSHRVMPNQGNFLTLIWKQ